MNADCADAAPAGRSPAAERRLRQRRSEARIRSRLAADAALLAGHHASAPCGQTPASAALHADSLRGQLVALRAEVLELRELVLALRKGDGMVHEEQEQKAVVKGAVVEHSKQRCDATKSREEVSVVKVPHIVLDDVVLDRERLSKTEKKSKGGKKVGSVHYSISFSARPDQRRWGVSMIIREDALVIRHMDEKGLIAMLPSAPVRIDDTIISVNGIVGAKAMDSQILAADEWHVTLARKF